MLDVAPTHARVLSIVLATTVVLGGWLALEYANQPSEPLERTPEGVEGAGSVRNPIPSPSAQDPLYVPARPSRDVSVTYKCQKNGRVSFGDQPCPVGAKELSVTATEQSPPADTDRLSRMKKLAAQMESDRLARERALQANRVVLQAVDSQPNNAWQCKSIDDGIALIDARLRQPHDGQTGDYLTGERRKLTDKRFDLGC